MSEYSDSNDTERSISIGMGIVALVAWLMLLLSAAFVRLRDGRSKRARRATVRILVGLSTVLVLGALIAVLATPPPSASIRYQRGTARSLTQRRLQIDHRQARSRRFRRLISASTTQPSVDFQTRSEQTGVMALINDFLTSTRRSSDLSMHSADVFAEAEDHAVQITRRDGEPLVLMSQREADARASLLQFAADLITVTLGDEGTLDARMADRFPWMLALSETDRETCAEDLVNAARASFSTGQPYLAIAELTSWRETATAIAAGLGVASAEWLDDPESVERP